MLFRGLLITNLSGSLDGITASRNRGGSYLRERVLPVDPNTTNQQVLRTAFAEATQTWAEMSEAGRQAWNQYATRRTVPSRLGEQRHISGQAYFTRWWVFRYQTLNTVLSNSMTDTAPAYDQAGDFLLAPTVSLVSGNTTLRISWAGTPTWELDGGNFFTVFASTPRAPTINWFRGPYLIVGAVAGDPEEPPTSPQDIELPPARQPSAGEKLFVRIRMSREDYDLGHQHTFTLIGS